MALPLTMTAQTTDPPSGYKLVWSDEFNGNSLNEKVWNIESNGTGGGNQELQYYRRENVAVKDGNLILTARRENYNNKSFTSGRINSREKASFKYGFIQARIKFPKTANGLWPAYWMMGNDYGKVGWPRCGEMDIVELGNVNGIKNNTQDRYFAGTLHYGKSASASNHKQMSQDFTTAEGNPICNDGYHIITVEWDRQFLNMYYDLADFSNESKLKARFFRTGITASDDENSLGHYFNKQFFFIFNLAVGGNFTGIGNAANVTALPNIGSEAKMYVDWVRVYQNPEDSNAEFVTPDSTNVKIPDTPTPGPVAPDSITEYGYWGSKALDDSGTTTFDFKNSTDVVLIGTSYGVTNAFSGKIKADYNVDNVKNFMYVWENTYTALGSEGVNSFGFNEGYSHLTVNSVGWSGLGYASQGTGKDLSMIDDDYIFHIAFRGTPDDNHASQEVCVGNAKFTLGRASLENTPVLGDFKRDGSWTYFDIPVIVLKKIAGGDLFDASKVKNYTDNVVSILSGGVQGTDLQFDNIFFYKNPNVKKGIPSGDSTTKIGQYASKAVEDGKYTFNLDNVGKAVLVGTSSGVTEALASVTAKNYNVDEVNNFFWLWEGGDYTGLPSQGANSFGWDESSTRLQVTGASSWCGAGYASQGTGKDLSMIDDSWYLHFAMRGDDNLTHPSQTITVGNSQFVIGNATSNAQILGDYKRDGEWYNFDIPVAKLQQMAGGTLFTDASNFIGNVFAVVTTHQKGAEVNFDQVFFYTKKDGSETPDEPEFATKALDNTGKTTFDLEGTGDYVLIGTTGGVYNTLKNKVAANYNVDDTNNFLYIWEGTFTSSSEAGVNSFGYDEGGNTVFTVGTMGWSGLGYASQNKGKDLSMLNDDYYLHFGIKATDNTTYLFSIGNAKFAIGKSGFTDNNIVYAPICDFPRDGEWYNIDIPYSEITSRATTVFDNADNYLGNAFSVLAGSAAGTKLMFDQVFFYRKVSTGIESIQDTKYINQRRKGIYDLMGRKLEKITRPGIYIVNGKKTLNK